MVPPPLPQEEAVEAPALVAPEIEVPVPEIEVLAPVPDAGAPEIGVPVPALDAEAPVGTNLDPVVNIDGKDKVVMEVVVGR